MQFAFSVNWKAIALPLQVGLDTSETETLVYVRLFVFTFAWVIRVEPDEYNEAMTVSGWWEADGSERYSYS